MNLPKIAESDTVVTWSRLSTLFASAIGLPLLAFLAWSVWTEVQSLSRDASVIKSKLTSVDKAIDKTYTKDDAVKDGKTQEVRDAAQDRQLFNHEARIFSLEGRRRFFPQTDTP